MDGRCMLLSMRACGLGAAWEERILPSIAEVARAAIGSAAEDVHGHPTVGSSRSSARFEVFGLDVLLDEAWRPWLLEVNESPNLRDHGREVLEPMLGALVDTVLLPRGSPTSSTSGAWRALR